MRRLNLTCGTSGLGICIYWKKCTSLILLGAAVSLISKQLEIFRAKHHEQENQLLSLIEIARDNDLALDRMHKLTLALLDASSLEEVLSNLNIVF